MTNRQIIVFPAKENHNIPANILNLPAYAVTAVTENEHDYHINAEVKAPPVECPLCHSPNLVGFGRREQLVKDLPMRGRLTIELCKADYVMRYDLTTIELERARLGWRWLVAQAVRRVRHAVRQNVALRGAALCVKR